MSWYREWIDEQRRLRKLIDEQNLRKLGHYRSRDAEWQESLKNDLLGVRKGTDWWNL